MIAEARRAVRRERRRTVDEHEAFASFANAVRDLPTEDPSGGVQVGARLASADAASSTRAVRDAYERTVMAVPHYREEYDDTYTESLAAELGPSVAAAATASALTPAVRRGIVAAAESARADRARFVEALDAEDRALREADARLGEVLAEAADLDTEPLGAMGFGALDGVRARLRTLERKVETVGEERQAGLREQTDALSLPSEAPDLPTYVYQAYETTYPVLSVVVRASDVLGRVREDVERAMARV